MRVGNRKEREEENLNRLGWIKNRKAGVKKRKEDKTTNQER